MGNTFRILADGRRIDSDGTVLNAELSPLPIRHEDKTITGTQLQSGNATPIEVVVNPTTEITVPFAWSVDYEHAGGTDFSVNASLELISETSATVLGEATNAISGAADKLTVGTIASAAMDADGDGLLVRVKTGDPTGGHATASATVRVYYYIVNAA